MFDANTFTPEIVWQLCMSENTQTGDDMHRHVMIDIETIGTNPGDAILSIAAVEFNRTGVKNDSDFLVEISTESCVLDYGMNIDMETVDEFLVPAEADFTVEGRELDDALRKFNNWLPNDSDTRVWANSPSFDCKFLDDAYERCGMQQGWNWYRQRDVRTAKEFYRYMSDKDVPDNSMEGTPHEPLYDAKNQAMTVVESQKMAEKARRALKAYNKQLQQTN